jgi:hypothetical protein
VALALVLVAGGYACERARNAEGNAGASGSAGSNALGPGASGGSGAGGAPSAAGGGASGGGATTVQDRAERTLPPASTLLPAVPEAERTVVTSERIYNAEAPVPPQCYTKTDGVHNPCFTCHQLYDRETDGRLNGLDDGSLQGEYEFSDVGTTNHWTNLFVDRREWLASIDDEVVQRYVDEDNYSSLRARLEAAGFRGYIPDLRDYAEGRAAFDEQGLARDGSGWVAFNYKPFPGTFWPTNGATDDVLVRLPREFRELGGALSRDAYYVNLILLELNLKDEQSAELWPVDEHALGVDLDGSGALGTATTIKKRSHYVGDAKEIALEFQQFPTGAELLHSVRYLGLGADERITVPRRMKELRYMKKLRALPRYVLDSSYANERKEKLLGELPNYAHLGDGGFDNGFGWSIAGFVEDYEGELRPQSYEEGMFCMGCHSAIGTTLDSTFSFVRKVPGGAGFGYINLVGMPDAPSRGEPGVGEILAYLRRAGGGSEFRENSEMRARWFKADGTVDEDKVRAADVYTLLAPSARRALDLNKAYLHIVRHQSFRLGRDATWTPVTNVLSNVDETVAPLEEAKRFYGWDIRLAWPD